MAAGRLAWRTLPGSQMMRRGAKTPSFTASSGPTTDIKTTLTPGVGRRGAGVDAADDLGIAAGEVGQELVVGDGDLHLEMDGVAVAVVVHVLVHLPGALGHLGQALAGHQLALVR